MFLLLLLDADCSGRTLATLLVAWVAAAMIASVLLKWEYMWIVLTILTLLFLFVCGYIAYNARKAHARTLLERSIEEQIRQTNALQRRERQIWTVSGITADNHRETDSSAYSTHIIADLPPSYTSVVYPHATSASSDVSLTIPNASRELKLEEPPPYSAIISSRDMHDRNEVSNESNTLSSRLTNETTK